MYQTSSRYMHQNRLTLMNNTKTSWTCCQLTISAIQRVKNYRFREIVGKSGLGGASDRTKTLLQCYVINDLVNANTVFPHNDTLRATCISRDGRTMNQIDYILVQICCEGGFQEKQLACLEPPLSAGLDGAPLSTRT